MDWKWTGDRAVTVGGTEYKISPSFTMEKAVDVAEEIAVAAEVHAALSGAYQAFSEGRATDYSNARNQLKALLGEFKAAGTDLNKMAVRFCGSFEPDGMMVHFQNDAANFAQLCRETIERLKPKEETPRQEEPAKPLPPKPDPAPPVPPGEGA